jgi:16S rRNA pseudouridine516 synthase
MPTILRLQRILANRGYCNRSAAREFLKEHVVTVSGTRALKEDLRVDPTTVQIDGVPIDGELLYLLMNKPLGVTCSHKDPGDIVYSLLPERMQLRSPQIVTVGRLDKDTSGVLLLSDDGEFVHRLTQPKFHVPKTYLATLQHPLHGAEGRTFASGMLMLDGDDTPLLPAQLEPIDATHARLTITEGRYHQVRRMFAAVGNHVTELVRESFGPITTGDLPAGQFRTLSPEEVDSLLGTARGK